MGDYTTKKELEFLATCAKQSNQCIVEIGVLYGDTTKELLKNSNVHVYGIDPIIPDSMNKSLIGNYQRILENTNPFKDRFTFINKYSYESLDLIHEPIDLLFIDGDHIYESVKKDFEDWFPKVSKGGIILIHDSAPLADGSFNGWEGPKKLVKKLKGNGIYPYITIDTINGYKKI